MPTTRRELYRAAVCCDKIILDDHSHWVYVCVKTSLTPPGPRGRSGPSAVLAVEVDFSPELVHVLHRSVRAMTSSGPLVTSCHVMVSLLSVSMSLCLSVCLSVVLSVSLSRHIAVCLLMSLVEADFLNLSHQSTENLAE